MPFDKMVIYHVAEKKIKMIFLGNLTSDNRKNQFFDRIFQEILKYNQIYPPNINVFIVKALKFYANVF